MRLKDDELLKIYLEYRKGILFIRLKGELTKYTEGFLSEKLLPIIINNGLKYSVYNLKDINIIDNCGKEELNKCYFATKTNNGEMLLCNTNVNFGDQYQVFSTELSVFSFINV